MCKLKNMSIIEECSVFLNTRCKTSKRSILQTTKFYLRINFGSFRNVVGSHFFSFMVSVILLLAFSFRPVIAQVYVSAVNPSHGSLAGGTRLVIRGSGFSSNTNSAGNTIFIGEKYLCDPIPLHSTTNQIICKTRSALEGFYSTYDVLWTLPQNITVKVDGSQISTCIPSVGQTCTFQFSTEWYANRQYCTSQAFCRILHQIPCYFEVSLIIFSIFECCAGISRRS